MSSWRDNASQEAQNDLDDLFSVSLDAASALLEKNKEFYPFAVSLSIEGEISLIAADTGTEFPDSESLISELKLGLQSDESSIRAAALVADVLIYQGESSAVRVSLEHREGIALELVAPYSLQGLLKKKVQWGDLSAASGEHFVWGAE